jgi:hypothetical protein
MVLTYDIVEKIFLCHQCSGEACPAFAGSPIYTEKDVAVLRAMGIDPQASNIEKFVRELNSSDEDKQSGEYSNGTQKREGENRGTTIGP